MVFAILGQASREQTVTRMQQDRSPDVYMFAKESSGLCIHRAPDDGRPHGCNMRIKF